MIAPRSAMGGSARERVVTSATPEGFSMTLILASDPCLVFGCTTESVNGQFLEKFFLKSQLTLDRCGLAILPFLPFGTSATPAKSLPMESRATLNTKCSE